MTQYDVTPYVVTLLDTTTLSTRCDTTQQIVAQNVVTFLDTTTHSPTHSLWNRASIMIIQGEDPWDASLQDIFFERAQ